MGRFHPSSVQTIADSLQIAASRLRKRLGWPPGEASDEWIIQESFISLYAQILIALESLGLVHARETLVEEWKQLKPNLTQYDFDHDSGACESPALWLLDGYIDGIRSVYCAKNVAENNLLDKILRSMAVLVHKLDARPTCEEDIAKIMNAYLSAAFDDYTTSIGISGVVNYFKPDGGLRRLSTAIEFKYADTTAELTRAIRGIIEDIGGYSGSNDWNQFVAAIYMTQPFESEDRVQAEILRAGGTNWRVILVNGGKDGGGRAAPRRPGKTAKNLETSDAGLRVDMTDPITPEVTAETSEES